MCAISCPIAVASTWSGAPCIATGRMTMLPAVTGPETVEDQRSSTSSSANAALQRSQVGQTPPGSAVRQMRSVFAAAAASCPARISRKSPSAQSAIEAGVAGSGTVRGRVTGWGVAGDVGRGPNGVSSICCRTAMVGAAVVHRRTLAAGSSSAAISPATQTACRCPAGPCRIARQASAVTPTTSGVCQREFSRNVSRSRLIVSMGLLLRALQ
jgi:hypothetical protein